MDTLSRFIRAEACRPFGWGGADCILFGADWLMIRLGLDPAARFRGAYQDEAGAARIIAGAGGFEALMRTALASIGVAPPVAGTHGVRGDVGLIRVLGPNGPTDVCGVCTGRRWAARARRGVTMGMTASPSLVWPIGMEA